jgi:hypothetical protein
MRFYFLPNLIEWSGSFPREAPLSTERGAGEKHSNLSFSLNWIFFIDLGQNQQSKKTLLNFFLMRDSEHAVSFWDIFKG